MDENALNQEGITQIDVQGFKIRIDELQSERIIPDFFNTPLIGQWEITRKCNLRCVFCYNNSGIKLFNELTHEKKIDVAKQIVNAKIYRMCISGGEPILCSSFWEIAKIFKEGKILCNTITNGFNINEENASLYAKYFGAVQISLDGRNYKTHDKLRCRKGSWEKAVKACGLISENGGKISIATVAIPENLKEIPDLIDLAYSLGALEVRIDEVKCTGRAAKIFDNLALSKKQTFELIRSVNEKKNQYSEKTINIDLLPKTQYNYVMGIAEIPPVSIYISPTGTCAVDPVLPFSGGSLKVKSLKKIWDEIRSIHKNKEFVKYCLKVKNNRDFGKLNNIPYTKGELHD